MFIANFIVTVLFFGIVYGPLLCALYSIIRRR